MYYRSHYIEENSKENKRKYGKKYSIYFQLLHILLGDTIEECKALIDERIESW